MYLSFKLKKNILFKKFSLYKSNNSINLDRIEITIKYYFYMKKFIKVHFCSSAKIYKLDSLASPLFPLFIIFTQKYNFAIFIHILILIITKLM
jgi:hypothetical protein